MQTQNSMNDSNENLNKIVLSREQVKICDGMVGDLANCYYENYGHADVIESIETIDGEYRKARSLVPFQFANDDWNSFKWQLYKEDTTFERGLALNYIQKFNKTPQTKGIGLYIFSEVKGSGKTKLAVVILNQIMSSRGICGKFLNVPTLLEMTKQSYKEFAERESINSIRDAELLVLDDLGVGQKNAWIDSQLYSLIDYRLNQRKPIIVTSNIPFENLNQSIDDRIASRLEIMCPPLHLPEQSIRSEKAKQQNEKFYREMME